MANQFTPNNKAEQRRTKAALDFGRELAREERTISLSDEHVRRAAERCAYSLSIPFEYRGEFSGLALLAFRAHIAKPPQPPQVAEAAS